MVRAYAFIDAEHVRQEFLRQVVPWRDLNLRKVAEYALGQTGQGWRGGNIRIDRVFIYGAIPEGATADTNEVASWLVRNNALIDTHVRYGRLEGDDRPRQKGVDGYLSVDSLEFTYNGVIDAALIVAGDADYVPVVRALRGRGILVCVCAFEDKLAADLKDEADRVGCLSPDLNDWKSILDLPRGCDK